MQPTCISSSTAEESDRPRQELTWHPHFDLRVGERDVVAYIDIPGVDEDVFQIDVKSDALVVTGERSFDHDLEDAEEYTQLGRPYGKIVVEIALAEKVNPDEATAKYKRGVLRVRMPRAHGTSSGRRMTL